ncbi:LIC12162 family protein [Phascolarctobacterium sp.]|uniref:LIC12162 family transferase n=1 Tax=Phascolarctobacterium sp. TaxID=2049039 RepID=UPI00307848BB
MVNKLVFDTTERQTNNRIFLNIESIISCNEDVDEILKDKSLQELKKINIDNDEVFYYYKFFLELLSEWLNNIHDEKHKKIYWETILTPWLYEFVSRELYIYKGINILIDNELSVSDYYEGNEYLATEDINDSFNKLWSDKNFNKITYSLQMKYFENISFVKKEICHPLIQRKNSAYISKIKRILIHPDKIIKYIGRSLLLVILKNSERLTGYDNRIVLRLPFPDNFHRRLNLLKLLFKSKFKIVPYMDKNNKSISNYSKQDRNNLMMYLQEKIDDDRFSKILAELISYALPKPYLEGYKEMVDFVSKLIKNKPQKIFGVSPFFTSDDFNMYTAYWKENGVQTIGAQHGLNYAFEQDVGITEYIISDIFYTWGNLYENDNIKIKKNCAWDLQKTENIRREGENILYGLTDYNRCKYSIRYSRFIDYMHDNIVFLSNIDPKNHKNVIIRLRNTAEKNWGYSEKIRVKCPWVKFSDANITSFLDDLKDTKIFVCDNISTCIAEALVNNIPTIIFLDKNIIEKTFYKGTYEILDKMEHAKMLFYSPQDAANHLNTIYTDVDAWWNDDFTQQIKNEFCESYIKTDSNWLDKWCELLMSEEKA